MKVIQWNIHSSKNKLPIYIRWVYIHNVVSPKNNRNNVIDDKVSTRYLSDNWKITLRKHKTLFLVLRKLSVAQSHAYSLNKS